MSNGSSSSSSSMLQRFRREAGAALVERAFRGLSGLGRLVPGSDAARQGIEVLRDIPYRPTGRAAHTLDVYRPSGVRGPEPLPVVLYVHGGAFRMLSKDTHWLMGISFARRGYVVFNINYRLAPRDPFPAAVEDACAALVWVHEHAERFGGDRDRIVLAGESAGANLATSLAVACAWRRPEPWAAEIFDRGIHPVAVLPACGILQVTDTERFSRRRSLPAFLQDRIAEVSEAYLGREAARLADVPGGLDLADPLLVLERDATPDRPLPPFFTFVGTRDPILDDTRRLAAALTRRGVRCDIEYYPGEPHAFHALMWRRNAVACWRRSFAFLDEVVPRTAG
jgi:acetyl esterase/lipase